MALVATPDQLVQMCGVHRYIGAPILLALSRREVMILRRFVSHVVLRLATARLGLFSSRLRVRLVDCGPRGCLLDLDSFS